MGTDIVGCRVGVACVAGDKAVGSNVGPPVIGGSNDGRELGFRVGDSVGDVVGNPVGSRVGLSVFSGRLVRF